MSGNPFRKVAPPQAPISTTVAPTDLKPATGGTRKSSSKGKRVRIQTPPPLSPDSPEAFPIWPTAPEHQISSPPPPLSASNERFISPFPAPDDRLEQELEPDQSTLDNTRRNSASDAAGMYTNGGTFNPFAKTLETMESKYNHKKEQKHSVGGAVDWSAATTAATSKKSAGKPAMDVDSFKRMLMGGKLESEQDVSSIATRPPPPAAFGSSTITTSTSVPAINTLDNEEDRSDLESASSEDDDDGPPPVITAPTTPSKPAPPLPDQQTPARGPQVVSFSDWSSFDQELAQPSILPASTSLDKTLPAAPRPPPPPTRRPRPATNEPLASSATAALEPPKQDGPRPPKPRQSSTYSITSDAPSPGTASVAQPFMPPPVAPRRRAHSNLSTSSVTSSLDIPTPTTSTEDSTPPMQQQQLDGRSRNDSIQSVTSVTPSSRGATSGPPLPPVRRAVPKPPIPSSPSPSFAQDQADSSSTNANHRTSITRIPSSSRSSPSAPRVPGFMPPPPPPRRRGSSKGSFDLSDSRRGSAVDRPRTSTDSGRPSLSIAREEDEIISESKEEKDLFADLDALQREVDALRKQIR